MSMVKVGRSRALCVCWCSCFILLLLCAPLVWAQADDWEAQAHARSDYLKKKNGSGTDVALKQELLKMRDEDQDIRARFSSASEPERAQLASEMEATDKRLTARLKQIVATKGWPTIALVGADASRTASLILIHSPDNKWQAHLLPRLQKLVSADKIFGSDIATLTDKLLTSEGKPQLFGTQFQEADGKMVILPVQDPAHLEERRAKYLLPPMAVYRKLLGDLYHMPVE